MGLVSKAPFAMSHNVFALADSICKAIHLQMGCVYKGQALETVCAKERTGGNTVGWKVPVLEYSSDSWFGLEGVAAP